MKTMLRHWSTKTIEDEFQTNLKVNVETEKEAWKWLKNFDKSSIFRWYAHSYITPSTRNKDYSSSFWLHEYATFPWKTFNDFSRWFYACRLVTLPIMCKHAVGASIHICLYIISDPSKLENLGKRRGRSRKAGPALSH
jgi:hypothetical protein